ncbi:aminoglycoside phosphotransferase family protein [Myxococcota bacterium]
MEALRVWGSGGTADPALTLLHGDASARRYVRVEGDFAGAPVVAMLLAPEKARFSEEAMGREEPDELPFSNVQRYLDGLGIRVPAVLCANESLGVVLLEDLGDLTVGRRLKTADAGATAGLYERAVDLLVDLQAKTAGGKKDDCVAFTRAFEVDLLRWELDHFLEYLLRADRGVTLSGADKQVVDRAFDQLAGDIAAWPRGFVHRDFQSRNLMLKGDEMVLIDFQDCLLGPQVYDLVALLRDSYVQLEPGLVIQIINRYLDGCKQAGLERPEKEILIDQFHRMTLQRKLKDSGRFVFIDRVKKNPGFLPFIPRSLKYVAEAFDHLPDLAPCREVLARAVPELSP